MDNSGSTCRGFTLLEVLVALAIISLTLFLAYEVNSKSLEMERSARIRMKAIFAAESALTRELEKFPPLGVRSEEIEWNGDTYTYTVSVRETPHPDAEEVEVSLTFYEDEKPYYVTVNGVTRK